MRKQSLHEQYTTLQQSCQEMQEHILDLQKDLDLAYRELYYLHAFINYKNLGEEFSYFQKNAHEEHSGDLPFPWLTL